jgi:N-methylhydantoinase A
MGDVALAIDIGGTFTDVVAYDRRGKVGSLKVPSTASGEVGNELTHGLVRLLDQLLVDAGEIGRVTHGSTVATNAVLQLSGPTTALLTTRGFRDVLELRRIRYPERYNPLWRKPPPLVPRRLRLELGERIAADGEVVIPIDLVEVRSAVAGLVEQGVVSLAVCLLNSYRNPAHEEAVRDLLRSEFPSLMVSYSAGLAPIAGEYERTSTTVCDAYVKPIVVAHQRRLKAQLEAVGVDAPLLVMQSSGLLSSGRRATESPVFGLESGPAAGVMGATRLSSLLGLQSAIAFDMGGTTAKACMIERGEPFRAAEYEIGATASVGSRLLRGAGYLLRVRSVDVAEVGAGGGSIVEVDGAGGLRVGPESAGADPGPVCYGRAGERPTVTDANLLLGYLNPHSLLGGDLPVDVERARSVWTSRVADPTGLDVLESALGAHRLANANMERAVRLVSSERGFDPRSASLIAFGGSGPVHAAGLAAGMGIRRVIIPPAPGVFSAVGLMSVGVGQEYVRETHMILDGHVAAVLEQRFEAMSAEARVEFGVEPAGRTAIAFERFLDLRYQGQHRELTIAVPFRRLTPHAIRRAGDLYRREFARTFGYTTAEPILIENVRLVVSVAPPDPPVETVLAALSRATAHLPPAADRPVVYRHHRAPVPTPVIRRSDLDGTRRRGPMVIEEYDSTTVVPPESAACRDEYGNLIIETRVAA